MEYKFFEDLSLAKEILKIDDAGLYDFLGIPKSTYYRWIKNQYIPNDKELDHIYNILYSKGIDFNRIKEELYFSLQSSSTKILFYGSKSGITGDISIDYGNDKRDFGKGFYAGESVKQAISFVSSFPNPSIYYLKLNNFNKIKKIEFEVSKEWMILIAYFRGKIDIYKNSKLVQSLMSKIKGKDLVIAPIADNTMYSIINEFIEGSITDEQCINSLSANRLGKQYVFLNNEVIHNNLEILSKGFICDDEKNSYLDIRLKEDTIGKQKVIAAKRAYAGKGKYIEDLLQ